MDIRYLLDGQQIDYEINDPLFYDTETCGLHGMAVLIQYAIGDGPVNLYSIWKEPVVETLKLIKAFMQHEGGIVGFNLAYDHFHLSKIYTVFSLIPKSRWHELPEDMIDLIADIEPDGRFGPALKPVKVLDLMTHARKGPYQTTMDRSDIRLKKVPAVLAQDLADILSKEIKLDDVLFEKNKDKKVRWKVYDLEDSDMIDFKDVCLKFKPSSALKALAKTAGVSKEKRLLFSNVELGDEYRPQEYGYAPYAKATPGAGIGDWKKTWARVIQFHIDHWHYKSLPREYAEDDVHDTRGLFHHFHEPHIVQQFGAPEFNDVDSVLACMVASVRWRGFAVDDSGIEEIKKRIENKLNKVKYNFNSPRVAKEYILQVTDPTIQLAMTDEKTGKISSSKNVLLQLSKIRLEKVCDGCFGEGIALLTTEPCEACKGEGTVKVMEKHNQCDKCIITTEDSVIYDPFCDACGGKGFYEGSSGPCMPFEIPHPAAIRAQEIMSFRNAQKELELFDKILVAKRFHASFKVIGTLSGRMAGGDSLNAQGIKSAEYIRNKFPLAEKDYILCGGDFDGFEVALMEAAYSDPKLRERLMSGKKMHGLFGVHLFPGHTYEQICATKDLPGQLNLYGRSKTGVFAIAYGGTEHTLVDKVNIDLETATNAYQSWCTDYVVWGQKRKDLFNMFCSMRQPGGLRTKVEWHEPADKVVSMFGFPRYFNLEMTICKKLFDLADDPPKEWKAFKGKIVRRDREQTAEGASKSALFAAAFGVQSSAMRAAANHVIQSSGATITKRAQAGIWMKFQPNGIHEFMVIPMNIHDEIMCPTKPEICDDVKKFMGDFIEEYKKTVPLLAMKWKIGIPDWSDKDSDLVRFQNQSWKKLRQEGNKVTIVKGGHTLDVLKEQLDPMIAIINGVEYPITNYDALRHRACIKGPDNYKWYKEEEIQWKK